MANSASVKAMKEEREKMRQLEQDNANNPRPRRGRTVKDEQQCIDLWKEQINEVTPLEYNGEIERFKQCLDKDSFGAGCYDPTKVISSFGRVWSVERCRFIQPERTQEDKNYGYWRTSRAGMGTKVFKEKSPTKKDTRLLIHRLVANYFCDKSHITKDNEHLFEVHHLHRKKHFEDTIFSNIADNLCFEEKEKHDQISGIEKMKNPDNIDVMTKAEQQELLEKINQLVAKGLTAEDIKAKLDLSDNEIVANPLTARNIINAGQYEGNGICTEGKDIQFRMSNDIPNKINYLCETYGKKGELAP